MGYEADDCVNTPDCYASPEQGNRRPNVLECAIHRRESVTEYQNCEGSSQLRSQAGAASEFETRATWSRRQVSEDVRIEEHASHQADSRVCSERESRRQAGSSAGAASAMSASSRTSIPATLGSMHLTYPSNSESRERGDGALFLQSDAPALTDIMPDAEAASDDAASHESDWLQSRLDDLRIQLDAAKSQLMSKEDTLASLRRTLVAEEKRTVDTQEKLSAVANAGVGSNTTSKCQAQMQAPLDERMMLSLEQLRDMLVETMRQQKDIEMASFDVETAIRLHHQQLETTRPASPEDRPRQSANDSKIHAIRNQMMKRLAEVKDEIEAQFNEERDRLQGRIEFLARLNERKDAEIESLESKKGEISNLIEQLKSTHKSAISKYQSKYEHENKQMLQAERNASKFQREKKLLGDECERLRERLRKASGSTPPATMSSTPGASRSARIHRSASPNVSLSATPGSYR
ncbi:hypothetical protein DIPPA_12530 [Diplonema papillatum]|nr:hypothetical protein DIPPA_12530 [Diplonema papillatum]